MHVHLLAKTDCSARVSGKLTGCTMVWHPLPSLTPEESFCTCVVPEVSLTSRMRNMWSLYLLSKQDAAPPCSCHNLYLEVSVHRGQIPVAQPGTHLSPVLLGLKPSQSPDWVLNPWCLLIKITHLLSGLTAVQVLHVSVQKGFSERQSDR